MARLQYQRAAKAGGYRPQQVDERNIARMREESNRVIEGMRRAANAEIESRREVARSMKEDAAYTKGAKEKNFQIQTQNTQREIAGLQAQARRDQDQAAINQQATESIFKSISSLSSTANKYVNDLQKQREQEAYNEEFYDQDPNANAILQLTRYEKESRARVASQERLSGIQQAEANGADPVTASKLKEQDPVTQYDFTDATVSKFFRFQYVDERNARLADAEKVKGEPLTYEEKQQVIAQFRDDIYRIVGSEGISADLVKPHLTYAYQADSAFYTTERAADKQERDARRGENHLAILNNVDPKKRQEVFNSSFPHLVDVYGYTGALDKLQSSVFNVQTKTGEFPWSPDAIDQLVLPTEGKTWAEKYSDKEGNPTGRRAELLAERVRLDNQFRTQQRSADNLAHAEAEQTLFRAFMSGPRTVKDAEEKQRMYVAITGKESVMLANASKHFSIQAEQARDFINEVSKLPDYALTKELEDKAVAADPVKGAIIKARGEAYREIYKSDAFKKAKNTIDTTVSGTTSFGSSKAGKGGELDVKVDLYNRLEEETQRNIRAGMKPDAAAAEAGRVLTDEYTNTYRVKGSRYYREVSRNGTISYPYLPVVNRTAAQQSRQRSQELRATVKKDGFEEVLVRPFSFMTEKEIEYTINNYGKPGFRPPQGALEMYSYSNGMPLHSVLNAAIKSSGKDIVLKSPLRMGTQEVTLPPEDEKILSNPNATAQAKLAVLNKNFNPQVFQSASTMRPGSPVGQIIGPNTGIIVTDPADGPGGTDAVIKQGQRGAQYSWPVQGQVLKVVNDRSTEYRLEEGATKRDFGNHVEIRFRLPSGREVDALVSHFDKVADLKPGDTISPNTFIGTQGRSGSTTGAHVSFDFYQKGTNIPDTEARDWFLKTYLR
jgi:hypothetical protein